MIKPLFKSTKKTKLHDLMDTIEPQIRQAFIEAVNSIKNKEVLDQLAIDIQNGDVNKALQTIEQHMSPFASKTISFYSVAGAAAAKTLSDLVGIVVDFNQTNYRAVKAMQTTRLRLITEFREDQREIIRDVMTRSIAQGINPRIQADEIKDFIGLTSRQMKSVENYRRLLQQNSLEALSRQLRDRRFDETVEEAHATNSSLTSGQINRMVERYAERQLNFRAETIARTEALRAVNQGNYEMLLQSVESGYISQDDLENEWVTAHDSRVRESHFSMEGQKRKLGEPFISGNGNRLDYPGDPSAPANDVINCRCVLVSRLKGGV